MIYQSNINEHYLYPATIYIAKQETVITTVLGSCVSVTMYDEIKKIGGMNHYLLPLWNGKELATPKFGNIAIKKLLQEMLNLGCNKNNIIAKVFGGAEVIEHLEASNFFIGKRNIEIAHEVLNEEKIKIAAESTAGKNGRKIVFNTLTGVVKMRLIERTM